MLTEIKFSCGQCGQHISADADAAGVSAECPNCRASVTVPHLQSDRRIAFVPAGESEADPQWLRQTLRETTLQRLELERDLTSTREELATARDHADRLNTTATHLQAELKTFQTERVTLKSELAAARQRIAALEADSAKAHVSAAASHSRIASLDADLAVARQHAAAAETQLSAKESELAQTLERLAAAEALAAQLEALQTEHAALREELKTAKAEAAELTKIRKKLKKVEKELKATNEKFIAADEACKSLAVCLEEAQKEVGQFRRALTETELGRELMSVRETLSDTQRDLAAARADSRIATEDLQRAIAAREEMSELLRTTRVQLGDAEKRAEATSDATVRADNDLLRGIIARQNAELAEKLGELHKLRRARFGLRFAFVLFAAALAGLIAAAIHLLGQVNIHF